MPKLTKSVIKQEPRPIERPAILWDDVVPGFGAKIYPSKPTGGGKVSYIVRYRTHVGRQREKTLGSFEVLGVDDARNLARRLLAEVARGADPIAEQRRDRSEPTVAEFSQVFLEEHSKRKKSYEEDRRKFRLDILPALGRLKLSNVSTADCQSLHAAMSDRPIAANRVRALLSTMFEHAERLELRSQGTNPTKFVKKYPEVARERYLSANELAAVGQALTEIRAEQPHRAVGVDAIRLLALTGCRRNEILSLKWGDWDKEARCLRLRDSKSGPRTVPLEKPSIDLLAAIPGGEDADWIFPSVRGDGHIRDIRGVIKEACKRAKVTEFRPHDLRHTKASVGANQGYSLQVIGAMLGHTRASTTERYAHLQDDGLRRAERQTQEQIAAGISPPAMEPGGELPVIDMPKAAKMVREIAKRAVDLEFDPLECASLEMAAYAADHYEWLFGQMERDTSELKGFRNRALADSSVDRKRQYDWGLLEHYGQLVYEEWHGSTVLIREELLAAGRPGPECVFAVREPIRPNKRDAARILGKFYGLKYNGVVSALIEARKERRRLKGPSDRLARMKLPGKIESSKADPKN